MLTSRSRAFVILLALVLASAIACSEVELETTGTGSNGAGAGGSTGSSTSTASTGSSASTASTGSTTSSGSGGSSGGCGLEGMAGGSPTSVTGRWCGNALVTVPAECGGDEVGYAELSESAGVVTGSFCEAYQMDCYCLQNGAFAAGKLTFSYQFDEFGTTQTVDGNLELSADGATLTGNLHSSKCSCDVSATLHRL